MLQYRGRLRGALTWLNLRRGAENIRKASSWHNAPPASLGQSGGTTMRLCLATIFSTSAGVAPAADQDADEIIYLSRANRSGPGLTYVNSSNSGKRQDFKFGAPGQSRGAGKWHPSGSFPSATDRRVTGFWEIWHVPRPAGSARLVSCTTGRRF